MQHSSLLSLVNLFMGVDHPGNCLCGPHLPRSIVRLGPDMLDNGWASHGYRSGRPIKHFSHTHVSGTGGGGRYGNIGVMPFLGLPRFSLDPAMPVDEQAVPGYYTVTLLPRSIRVELTSTPQVGVHRYHFPGDEGANLLFDLGAVIQMVDHVPGETTGASIGGFVEILSPREIAGRADLRGGWGHTFPYSVHFYAVLSQPADRWQVADAAGVRVGVGADGPHCKAVAHFSSCRQVELHVGVSFVSLANAREAVRRETHGKTFTTIREEAEVIWERALSRININGGSDEVRSLFYTLFSRLLAMPTDLGIDNEFPDWKSGVRQFTDLYCLWDSVRNANALLALIDPPFATDLLQCLLDIGEHTGWVPDAWITGHSAMVQGGCSADILFCEAALKGLPGIDYYHALCQMRKNGEVEPDDPRYHGRYLHAYQQRQYLSTDTPQCVSRHLEYTYQDWCIARLAEQLGEDEVARRYDAQSDWLWHLWRDDLCCFAPRTADGNWVNPFDPNFLREDSWNDPYFYEGSGRQWSFHAFQDFAGLMVRHGGPELFTAHLDDFFERDIYHSKETMLHIPYLYHYAGRPDKSAERVRACMTRYFHLTRDGLLDNEDMGCQSAFYLCSAMGLYPVMGQDVYLLIAPSFSNIEMALGTQILRIETPQAGADRPYIIAATLNGQPLQRAWLRHQEIAGGGVLRFEVAAQPGDWGRDELPPNARRAITTPVQTAP